MKKIEPNSIEVSVKSKLTNAPVIQMPKFTFDLLEEINDTLSVIPPRFGYAFKTNLNLEKDGLWSTNNENRIWTLTIKSEGALSINLIFNDFHLIKGA